MSGSPPGGIRMGTPTGRAVVIAATLGSGMTLLDGTVVNVALRTIGTDLHASLAELQWITNGYLLSLASLILLGGALGDRYGRRRVFVVGTVCFAPASLLCGLAPTPLVLIGARVLQGVGAALLTPGSLAMIQGVISSEDRAAAIGAWSGLGGIAAAIGPFVAGALLASPALGGVTYEDRRSDPMLPLGPFRSRTFSAANAMTLLVYAALGAVLFFLVLQLQAVGGYGARSPPGSRRSPSPSACSSWPRRAAGSAPGSGRGSR